MFDVAHAHRFDSLKTTPFQNGSATRVGNQDAVRIRQNPAALLFGSDEPEEPKLRGQRADLRPGDFRSDTDYMAAYRQTGVQKALRYLRCTQPGQYILGALMALGLGGVIGAGLYIDGTHALARALHQPIPTVPAEGTRPLEYLFRNDMEWLVANLKNEKGQGYVVTGLGGDLATISYDGDREQLYVYRRGPNMTVVLARGPGYNWRAAETIVGPSDYPGGDLIPADRYVAVAPTAQDVRFVAEVLRVVIAGQRSPQLSTTELETQRARIRQAEDLTERDPQLQRQVQAARQ